MKLVTSETKGEMGRRAAAEGADLIRRAIAQRGEASIIERGRWGPYGVILQWSRADERPRYFVADVREGAHTEAGP